MADIKGQTALVLGAAKGIGKAIARALAEAGTRIIITWHDWEEDARQTIKEFAGAGYDFQAIQVDLRKPDEIRDLFNTINNSHLDILINNIERGGMPVVHGPYTPEQWDLEMATTLKAKWFVFDQALPLLKKSTNGSVITFSSIAWAGQARPA